MDKRKASGRVHERGVETVDEKRNKIPSSLVRLEGKGASLALTSSTGFGGGPTIPKPIRY